MNNLSLSTAGAALGRWISEQPAVQRAAEAVSSAAQRYTIAIPDREGQLRDARALIFGGYGVDHGFVIEPAAAPRNDGWGTAEDWAKAGHPGAKAAVAAQATAAPQPFPWLLAAAALLLAAVVLR